VNVVHTWFKARSFISAIIFVFDGQTSRKAHGTQHLETLGICTQNNQRLLLYNLSAARFTHAIVRGRQRPKAKHPNNMSGENQESTTQTLEAMLKTMLPTEFLK
jgi:hypothetical protein